MLEENRFSGFRSPDFRPKFVGRAHKNNLVDYAAKPPCIELLNMNKYNWHGSRLTSWNRIDQCSVTGLRPATPRRCQTPSGSCREVQRSIVQMQQGVGQEPHSMFWTGEY
jgi:hypothetical protein